MQSSIKIILSAKFVTVNLRISYYEAAKKSALMSSASEKQSLAAGLSALPQAQLICKACGFALNQ